MSAARLIRRIAVTLVGVALLVVGVILLVIPGPGLVVIALGLFVLSREYDWARRRFDQIASRAHQAARQAARGWWSLTVSIGCGVALIAAGIVLIVVRSLPFSGPVSGISLIAAGCLALATLGYAVATTRADP